MLTLSGLDIPTGLDKLTAEQLRMLRRIEAKLSYEDLEAVYQRLVKPPIDTRQLIKDTGISGRQIGEAIEAARDILVQNPFIRPAKLQEQLTTQLSYDYD